MKKIITILLSFLFLSFQTVKAEVGVGITAAMHMFDATGVEFTRTTLEQANASHSEDVVIPEIFIETIFDNGGAFGLAYTPTKELGSKSRTDTNVDASEDNGTYTAEAELENVFQLYADIPVADVIGQLFYGKLGLQHTTVKTTERLNSGSAYPDQDVIGVTLGIGFKGDLGSNLYYKAEAMHTEFDDYKANSDAGNRVDVDFDDSAVKLSIGYKF